MGQNAGRTCLGGCNIIHAALVLVRAAFSFKAVINQVADKLTNIYQLH